MTKFYSFYLPQFHPFNENDEWWGKGFTEWRNVVKEQPRFSGHHQPQIPADLGFYDLRVPETRIAQSMMAAESGIDGFIYYHYWFHGKRIMDEPFNQMINSKEESFPFALCWANESWTRAWDGREREVLISQRYSDEDDDEHVSFLCDIFKDPRYIKVGERPLFLIYRIGNHKCPEKFILKLRQRALEAGLPGVYLCGVESSLSRDVYEKILSLDLDAFIDFQPNSDDFPALGGVRYLFLEALRKYLPDALYQYLKLHGSANKVVNYKKLIEGKGKSSLSYYRRVFPCVFPSWDNSARRKTATIIQNECPSAFGQWLEFSVKSVQSYPEDERVVFINAWNEWAEGCHLEPDLKNGFKFLNVIKGVKNGGSF